MLCVAVDVCRTRFATLLVDVSLESGPTIPAATSDTPLPAAASDGTQPMDVDSADAGEAHTDDAAVVGEAILALYTQRQYRPMKPPLWARLRVMASSCFGFRVQSNVDGVTPHSRVCFVCDCPRSPTGV
jgi:hypothetical protein